MTKPASPEAWANRVTSLLDAVLSSSRFPVKVSDVALELSQKLYPDDPIEHVHGDVLPGFDGALLRLPGATKGWTILYNKGFRSAGRVNFTLAHEFGHYLVHRARFLEGFRCSTEDIVRSDARYQLVETEANTFAAYLLMPFNDYRKQIPADEPATWETLSVCAQRYGVSLVAATLRWLDYTDKRAVVVLSRDGFVLWAKSSKPALRTGAYLRTKNVTVQVPQASPASQETLEVSNMPPVDHKSGAWFNEPSVETVIRSDAYDFTMSLLMLGSPPSNFPERAEEDDDGMVSVSDFLRTPFAKTP